MSQSEFAALLAAIAAAALTAGSPGSGAGWSSDGLPAFGETTFVTARFAEYEPGLPAITYDTDLVPVDSQVSVSEVELPDGGTTVVLSVLGLHPDHEYGAHVHVNGCGQTPAEAGPHFQNEPDPVTPSVDPAFANPDNEVWLDFVTDAAGDGASTATVDWQFGDRPAGSVVIHAMHTHTDEGEAGTAGARLACVNVDF